MPIDLRLDTRRFNQLALLATLIVFASLIALAGFAGWRAKVSVGDVRTALRRDLMHEGDDD